MKNNSIPEMVEAFAKPSKMLDATHAELNAAIDAVAVEAEHYGITKKKIASMPLRELMSEINRRRALQD